MAHFVIVGAGQAAASIVANLRSEGFDGDITILGAERHAPYERPPLSKAYLLGEVEEERLYLRAEGWYKANNINLLTNTRCVRIDPEAHQVLMEGDVSLAYDQLVLCTGADPRRLPAEIGGTLDGVYTMRDMADADAIAPELVDGRHALIIGGGYIGLEAAAVAANKGMKVTLIEMTDRILQRVAAPETSDYFRKLHQSSGVDIRERCGLERLVGNGDDRVTAAVLSEGTELPVDFVVVGIGVIPATTLAESAGLTCENGIAADEFGRTSAADIWTAGDCASLPWQGQRIRLESVGNAIGMGEAVAKNMLGADEPYIPKPWFWSDQYDVKLQIAGLNIGYDAVFCRDTAEGHSNWYYRDGQLISVDVMNDSRTYMIAKRLIEAGKNVPPDVAMDPFTNLKAMLKG